MRGTPQHAVHAREVLKHLGVAMPRRLAPSLLAMMTATPPLAKGPSVGSYNPLLALRLAIGSTIGGCTILGTSGVSSTGCTTTPVIGVAALSFAVTFSRNLLPQICQFAVEVGLHVLYEPFVTSDHGR